MLLFLFLAGISHAQLSTKPATTWWPDPATGLMWTGGVPLASVNWKKADDSCSALRLGGFTDWRLPTFDEMKGLTEFKRFAAADGPPKPVPIKHSAIPNEHEDPFPPQPYTSLVLKGGIDAPNVYAIWTSTTDGPDSVRVVFVGEPRGFLGGGDPHFRSSKITEHLWHTWVCTRSIEPDLLQIAKDAQVTNAVPDLLTLKAYVPLNKAKLAYNAGHFQDTITQSQSALAVKPDFARADWAIGISYGRLGQWDQAVASLDAALKMDKNDGEAKIGLKWAKESQEAARKGTTPKMQTPIWN